MYHIQFKKTLIYFLPCEYHHCTFPWRNSILKWLNESVPFTCSIPTVHFHPDFCSDQMLGYILHAKLKTPDEIKKKWTIPKTINDILKFWSVKNFGKNCTSKNFNSAFQLSLKEKRFQKDMFCMFFQLYFCFFSFFKDKYLVFRKTCSACFKRCLQFTDFFIK